MHRAFSMSYVYACARVRMCACICMHTIAMHMITSMRYDICHGYKQ